MKIKCIYNKIKGKKYDNITINREYIVLAMEFYDSQNSIFSKSMGDYILYRIEDDEGLVKPIPSKLFTILNSNLYKDWGGYINESCYSIIHKEWANPYFWDDFYNDEPKARETFQRVREQIFEEEDNLDIK